ncbi:MAG TPA: biosynthetic arginine decarboxylase [Acidobacteriota bacterium]|nr:biosynthetic arginine decarboxylase [Acidobacteriota bacterium]
MKTTLEAHRQWSIDEASKVYRIDDWGAGFFGINERGNVQIDPHQDGRKIDLKELIDEIQRKGMDLPVMLRFSNILQKRIEDIHQCFRQSIRKSGYQGRYFTVYPIKVNQQRQVVQEIVRFGRSFDMGLEAGSKPELHAVLAMQDNPQGLIICNGYKDEAYIRMALIGQKLDRRIFIVVEKPSELKTIFRLSSDLNIHPQIGLRVKLSSAGSGLWQSSGGESSKFGLTVSEILDALELASSQGMLDSIKLLHFHLGSQITDISSIAESLKEVAHFYSELHKAGCEIEFVDVGGGLGIDYDGSRSNAPSSVNYSIQDYADTIVSALGEICRQRELPHPNIVSESGRALTAHHSLLVMDVLEATSPPLWKQEPQLSDQEDPALFTLQSILGRLSPETALESWREAIRVKEEVLDHFKSGRTGLTERAKCEQLFWTVARRVYRLLPDIEGGEEVADLKERLSDKYFCNFSLFQSLPDSWAINQIFPMMPIHRLDECPDREATLQDITCDSDGKVDCFIGDPGRPGEKRGTPTLPVHSFPPQDFYLIGVFLVGAYQEILGDLHNLFGDTNAVHVSLNDDGSYCFEEFIHGENVEEVLDYVQFQSADLLERISKLLGIGLGKGLIQPAEAEEMMALYRQGLKGYTYLLGAEIE